jgi:hypothetical protein
MASLLDADAAADGEVEGDHNLVHKTPEGPPALVFESGETPLNAAGRKKLSKHLLQGASKPSFAVAANLA